MVCQTGPRVSARDDGGGKERTSTKHGEASRNGTVGLAQQCGSLYAIMSCRMRRSRGGTLAWLCADVASGKRSRYDASRESTREVAEESPVGVNERKLA